MKGFWGFGVLGFWEYASATFGTQGVMKKNLVTIGAKGAIKKSLENMLVQLLVQMDLLKRV